MLSLKSLSIFLITKLRICDLITHTYMYICVYTYISHWYIYIYIYMYTDNKKRLLQRHSVRVQVWAYMTVNAAFSARVTSSRIGKYVLIIIKIPIFLISLWLGISDHTESQVAEHKEPCTSYIVDNYRKW
jgi:hypothetical protein